MNKLIQAAGGTGLLRGHGRTRRGGARGGSPMRSLPALFLAALLAFLPPAAHAGMIDPGDAGHAGAPGWADSPDCNGSNPEVCPPFDAGQDIFLAGRDNVILRYRSVSAGEVPFVLPAGAHDLERVDRFAFRPAAHGSVHAPFAAGHASSPYRVPVQEPPSPPVPNPSTLLFLGAGILGFTGMCRKLLPTGKHGMD